MGAASVYEGKGTQTYRMMTDRAQGCDLSYVEMR